MEHGIPALIGQLVVLLRLEQEAVSTLGSRSGVALGAAGFQAESMIAATAASYGQRLLAYGFTIDHIVHDYGDLGQVVAEMAAEAGVQFPPEAFATLIRCVDCATAEAVTAYCQQRDRLLAGTGNRAMGERLALVTEELRGLVNNALMCFVAIKEGGVGLHGATAGVLERSLVGLNDLVTHVLVDVRLATGSPSRLDHVAAEQLIEEARMAASVEARSRGCELTVFPVERGLAFLADRQMLLSALLALLHNALERSRPRGQVRLKARATTSRVLFEVEDEGGELPEDQSARRAPWPREMPSHGSSGAGLDLSRLAVEAIGGNLGFRDIPGVGCVVTIDLPRGAPEAGSNVLQRTDPVPSPD